ncbi:MAG: hypothetical protein HWN67_20490 [Candidatus Helarchaeota archaeon]|nr:hypothetical protein [Candidatus Helarchaeota archaeon]
MVPISKGRNIKNCTPTCKFLRCQQKDLGRRFRKGSNLVVDCNFAPGEICEGHKCKYSFCVKYKMATDGKCMLNMVSQRKPLKDNESIDADERVKPLKSLKFKNKILKKMQDYDEF